MPDPRDRGGCRGMLSGCLFVLAGAALILAALLAWSAHR